MSESNISYAQNGEDIVLWRALGQIENGTYIDVGANDPTEFSVTKKFYDAGWHGIAIEPNPEYARRFRVERPRDAVFEAVASDSTAETLTFHLIEGTGLSTLVDDISAGHAEHGHAVRDTTVDVVSLNETIEAAGLAESEIHFMSIDTEGAETQVLASIDLTRFRPWVLVIEATEPGTSIQVTAEWQQRVEQAGYHFTLFDGLSRFYVADEHFEELGSLLTHSAGILDRFVHIERVELQAHLDDVFRQLEQAIDRENVLKIKLADAEQTNSRLEAELSSARTREAELGQLVSDLQHTLSWRVTAPLRAVRGAGKKA
ncbi:FkbM family methyltransferase [Subtercola endophyticus]|uniref:FkbM family methyltransferase n=1 Tax=Subtercola endophyticus TaxID=2895559 RepID=UPI001E3ABA9F|nr:FkbM family methyltransferase [Subtercola endophyticus]UFS57738.1 FkbM family methyltransferase [Subtercola endophyticus]